MGIFKDVGRLVSSIDKNRVAKSELTKLWAMFDLHTFGQVDWDRAVIGLIIGGWEAYIQVARLALVDHGIWD